MLERQEEYLLAKRWREHGDRDAAHKLVTSHLRLVTKIARDYRATAWRSRSDLRGHVGLSRRSERFEPDKASVRHLRRVVIKAAIQEYIQRSRSLVKWHHGQPEEGVLQPPQDPEQTRHPRRMAICGWTSGDHCPADRVTKRT